MERVSIRKSQKEEKTMATNERTSAIKQTATLKGDTQMNTNRETSATRESKMQITASKLIRWTGVAAILAGLIFAAYQPIQPPEVLSSVNDQRLGNHHPLEVRHVPPLPTELDRALRQASERDGVAWSGRLSPAEPQLGAPVGLCVRHSLYPAAAGNHGAQICG